MKREEKALIILSWIIVLAVTVLVAMSVFVGGSPGEKAGITGIATLGLFVLSLIPETDEETE